MVITETVTRQCCHPGKDFRVYKGEPIRDLLCKPTVSFCVHCGQLWRMHRAPGEMDAGWEKITILTTEP